MKTILALLGATIAATVLVFNLVIGADEAKLPDFEKIDTDKNGQLSTEEAISVPRMANVFAEADTDQDGQLSPEEYEQARRALES